jgi:hypothetical protein
MTIITPEMRQAALAEIRNPSGAYDKVEPDGQSPLEWMLTAKDTSEAPFFQKLARRALQEVRNPTGRYGNNHHEVANLLGVKPMSPVMQRILAHDQADMPVRGEQSYGGFDQDPSAAPISGSDCLQFLKLCLAKLQGPEREDFLMGLTDLLSTEEGASDGVLQLTHGNGIKRNGNGDDNAYMTRTGIEGRNRSNTQDNGVRPGTNQGALDRGRGRRPAQDAAIRSLQASSFARRFPDAMQIRFGGNGR